MCRGGVLEISRTAYDPELAAMFMALQLSIEAAPYSKNKWSRQLFQPLCLCFYVYGC